MVQVPEVQVGTRDIFDLGASVADHLGLDRKSHFHGRHGGRWWLMKSFQFESYHVAKVQMHRLGIERRALGRSSGIPGDAVHVGLYVEKGLGEVAFQYEPSLSLAYLMNAEWAWHRFMEGLASGTVVDTASKMVRRSGQPVYLFLSAHYARGQRPQKEVDEYQDWLAWSWDGQSLAPEGQGHLRLRVLKPLVGLASWRKLVDALRRLSLDMYWMDAYLGIFVRPVRQPSGTVWSAADVAERAVDPWLEWL